MNLLNYIKEAFVDGLTYDEAAQLCLRLYRQKSMGSDSIDYALISDPIDPRKAPCLARLVT